jgi:ABC-2 type transport system ATP-binding protein
MIEIKNVTKKYGTFAAVNDISFDVKDHEIVGFLGPNGAGKSTTMNMITGFIEPTSGKIIVNGYDVSKAPNKAKMQIGYMPENVPLYNDLTVKEFVSYMCELRKVPKKDRDLQIRKIIKRAGLTEVQDKLIKHISKGYKQRTSLAGALVGEPDVLILDEPTVGLDPKQITEIRNLIKKLGENHTVILSSHILSEVSQICSRVVIINHGKIVAVDTPDNLESTSAEEDTILITVEDPNNNMSGIKSKIKACKEIKKIKELKDGTVQYRIVSSKDAEVNKELFDVLPKENITICELRKEQSSLEDAYLKIINEKDEEIAKEEKREKRERLARQRKLESMDLLERRRTIREEKRKKQDEIDKEFFENLMEENKVREAKKKRRQLEKEKRKGDKK